MAQQTINVGTAPNDGTGTPLRTAFQYTNSNFSELYTAVGPSGNNIVCPGTVTVSAGTLALPSLTTAGDTNTGIYFPAADTIGFAEGGVEAMRINSAGNLVVNNAASISGDLTVDTSTLKVDSANNRVGVNTASPATDLEVRANGTAEGTIRLYSAIDGSNASPKGSYFSFRSGTTGGGTETARLSSLNRFVNVSGGDFSISTADTSNVLQNRLTIDSGGVFTFAVGGSTAMTLNSTGLGVGVASPTSKLTIGTGSYSAAASGTTGMYTTASGLEILSDSYFFGSRTGGVLMTLTAAGNLGIGVTPAGTGGCLQLKSGITFPATQVASSDANTLDDYEEGTWTGTLKGLTTDPTTPVTATGRYTKIGRQVSVDINFSGVNTTGASGQIKVSGVPFTSNGTVPSTGPVMMSSIGTFTGVPAAFIGTGTTEIELYAFSSAGAQTFVTHNAGTTRSLWVSLTYTV